MTWTPLRGAGSTVQLDERALRQPLRWRTPRRIALGTTCEVFAAAVPDAWIVRLWAVMACATVDCGQRHRHDESCWAGPPHTYVCLTQEPARAQAVLTRLDELADRLLPPDAPLNLHALPLRNVWLGVYVADQHTAATRLPLLLEMPAAVRVACYVPPYGPVEWTRWLVGARRLDWLLVGARPAGQPRWRRPDE